MVRLGEANAPHGGEDKFFSLHVVMEHSASSSFPLFFQLSW